MSIENHVATGEVQDVGEGGLNLLDGTSGVVDEEEASMNSISVVDVGSKGEIELLKRRMKTVDILLSYLKSKARIMMIPQFAHTSCGIKRQEGVGMVDRRGVPMLEWGREPLPKDGSYGNGEATSSSQTEKASPDGQEGEYIESIAKMVIQITDSMEVLLKRALLAEAEVDVEKGRAKVSRDEVDKKNLQLEVMWTRLEEMEKMAKATSGALKEMQMKLEDMEKETLRQRHRAAENEQELSKVRHDFGLLKSSLDFINTRETVANLERRILEVESSSERLNARMMVLEAVNVEKEVEVRRLMMENVQLTAQLHLKEANLASSRDQIKFLFDSRNES